MIGIYLTFGSVDLKSGIGSDGPHENPVPRLDAEYPAIVTLIEAVRDVVSSEGFSHGAGRVVFNPYDDFHETGPSMRDHAARRRLIRAMAVRSRKMRGMTPPGGMKSGWSRFTSIAFMSFVQSRGSSGL